MAFNVGDIVTIRKDLSWEILATNAMKKYAGKKAKIIRKCPRSDDTFNYYLDIDRGFWSWTEKMFDISYSIEKDNNTIYIKKGNKIIAKATCSPEDEFDEDFGVALAMARALKVLPKEHIVKKVETIDSLI